MVIPTEPHPTNIHDGLNYPRPPEKVKQNPEPYPICTSSVGTTVGVALGTTCAEVVVLVVVADEGAMIGPTLVAEDCPTKAGAALPAVGPE